MKLKTALKVSAALTILVAALFQYRNLNTVSAQTPVRFVGPTSSQPLALSAQDTLLAVANPDNNSVTLFDLRTALQKIAEIPVGTEPNNVAVSPDGSKVYVANTVSGTVTVLGVDLGTYSIRTLASIPVGVEPYGLALTPTGKKLYVTNARSNTVSVIDTASNTAIKTIGNVGIEPRGIAISNTGTGDDGSQVVWVTQFLALPAPGKFDGSDDAKLGHVTTISTANDTVLADIVLNPLADVGFKAAGDALNHIAPPATPVATDFKFTVGAYPNQLNNIALRGNFAFVPGTGASPNGPVRFDVNTESLLSVVDAFASRDTGKTINMHAAVGQQTGTPKRFITQPWAIAFKHSADEGYVASAASNILVKVKIDPASGAPTVQNDPTDATRVLEIPTGKNPRGIVISSLDKTAYVMNYVSRDVTQIDLTGNVERVAATFRSADLPTAGTNDDKIQVGKELYFTSIGDFDAPGAGQPAISGRMSNNGWGSCGSCHPFGLTDNVVWIFPSGPKRTIPQHVDFDHTDATGKTIRALNWSAERDEEEDFELNIRAVSGGLGLIVLADGVTQEPNVANLRPLASGGRNQLKVHGVPAWDAIKAYIQTIRAPISPVAKTDTDVSAGRQLFIQSNCQNCHGGPQWSSGKVRYTAPPDATLAAATGELIAELRPVGTFDPTQPNEVRATGAPPLGANGFNPPSLLSIFAFPQTFFHSGSANSLDLVMQNVAHRSAGTGGVDNLTDPTKRAQLIKFLTSIDAQTAPISPNAAASLVIVNAASFQAGPQASSAIATAGGPGLAGQILSSPPAQTAAALSGTVVAVQDAASVLRLAGLYFVSPNQVNFVWPAGMATGTANVTLTSGSGAVSSTTVQVAPIGPGIFAAGGAGTGVAAATAIRVAADGTQTPVTVLACSASGCTGAPISVGAGSGGEVYLTFYGTGVRGHSTATVRCTIGGVDAPVLFAGDQSQFPGLDQLNVQLPSSLKGRGNVTVVFTIDGQTTNPVTINVAP